MPRAPVRLRPPHPRVRPRRGDPRRPGQRLGARRGRHASSGLRPGGRHHRHRGPPRRQRRGDPRRRRRRHDAPRRPDRHLGRDHRPRRSGLASRGGPAAAVGLRRGPGAPRDGHAQQAGRGFVTERRHLRGAGGGHGDGLPGGERAHRPAGDHPDLRRPAHRPRDLGLRGQMCRPRALRSPRPGRARPAERLRRRLHRSDGRARAGRRLGLLVRSPGRRRSPPRPRTPSSRSRRRAARSSPSRSRRARRRAAAICSRTRPASSATPSPPTAAPSSPPPSSWISPAPGGSSWTRRAPRRRAYR